MTVLDIDIGNTFLKWRDAQSPGIQGSIRLADLDNTIWPDRVERVRIASVAGKAVNQQLIEFTGQRWGVVPEFAVTVAAQAGVVNSYKDPARMGVDRWLAIISAYSKAKKACWVVDCGSAITVEQIAADGRHLGGYIIPGLQLMSRNLLSNTAEIIVDHSIQAFDARPGVNTSEAVQHGINLLFSGLAEKVAAMAITDPIFVTGGDGELFSSLNSKFIFSPELVMDGLELALG
ncbi:type III pantothenate kinase [Amphritea sp. HPY]|uniref:type III pantothenate kinase n=1 Tax=Amphritea sp. HPY TaxID=3421652 RepID=UPI003D7C5A7B